jgi:RND superfamily putative drug exporter
MFLVPSVMKLLGDECWWAPAWLKRLHSLIGLGEIGLPDERRPRMEPEPEPEREPEPEDALVGAGAPVTQWPPHDPTRPTVEGFARPEAAARSASTPSLATTAPMPSADNARADEPTVAQISRANDPETNGEVTEDAEIESWLSALRPPSTSDTEPVRSADDDDPAATRAIPTRLQPDPDAT